ncbi:M67 family metallopeptidase [soil metagenome]
MTQIETHSTVVLTSDQRAAIDRHAEATYPDECCGIMLGRQVDRQRVIERLIEIANEWDSEERRRRFLITDRQYMQAEKQARQAGLDLLGFYHSHPDAPARPSEFDREHAWPFYSYLIAGVADGKTVDLTGWQLRNDRSGYDEIEIQHLQEENQ